MTSLSWRFMVCSSRTVQTKSDEMHNHKKKYNKKSTIKYKKEKKRALYIPAEGLVELLPGVDPINWDVVARPE